MKKIKGIFLTLAVVVSVSAWPQNTCKVTYVANDGFLVETATKKILVDALFGGFDVEWCHEPDSATMIKLENAEPPFDNVDIIAITHRHFDHLNTEMLINYAKKDIECVIICPVQVDSVLRTGKDYDIIKNNIIAVTPEMYADTTLSVKGIEVKIYRFEHNPYYVTDEKTGKKENRHRNVEDLGFLFRSEGMNIFHNGDANAANEFGYQCFNLDSVNIHVAFLDRMMVMKDSLKDTEFIKEYISSDHIVLMHLEPGYIEYYKQLAVQLRDGILYVDVFEKSMESKSYSIKK